MTKSLEIHPSRLAKAGKLGMPDIPLYSYQQPLHFERKQRGDAALKEVLRHMLIVREFELMLNEVRSTGKYADVECAYRGPAHLSVGQEAAAVGMALALTPSDHIFGNHRSHGEFIAKGLSAINQLGKNALASIMAAHNNGALLRSVETHLEGDEQSTAENFLLLGLLTEIFHARLWIQSWYGWQYACLFPTLWCLPEQCDCGWFSRYSNRRRTAQKI